jgi:murein DD-endopeptidase MepM/ murein hydrolase activator NlpD
MMCRPAVLLALVSVESPVALRAQAAVAPPLLTIVTLPSPPARGSVMWLVVTPVGTPDSSRTLDGTAAGEPLHFERLPNGRFRTLVGVPLEGGDSLPVALRLAQSATSDSIDVTLTVTQPVYASERLTVAPRYAEPDSASRARIDAELAQSRAISRQAHDTPRLWSGPFLRPRPSRITSVYGTGREFNGRVTSRHLGTDFAGAVGAPVRAAGRAVVALVADFYLAGHTVYLDHGGGLVTGYFHLSRVDVTAGDTVAAGAVIGAVGRSGRATGPHLHWIARYGAITVDPMSLFVLPKVEPGDSGGAGESSRSSPRA